MYLQSSIMSQISRQNSFGKVVFPFLVGNFMSRDRNWFFGRHFVILYPIFDFFVVFWFFWITLSVARISPPKSFGKVLFWVRVHRDPAPPPLTTNESAEGLDHLSVKDSPLTGGNWQKWKRVFQTCPSHETYRDEAGVLKSCKYTWKITIFVKLWNLGQYRENLIFCE